MIRGQNMKSVKHANYVAVMRAIRERQPIARTDLSEATGLTGTTISNIVSRLISLGLVREVGKGQASRKGGRRPIILESVPEGLIAVGVDIRRDKITVLAADMSLRVLNSHSLRIPATMSREEGINILFNSIDTVIQGLPQEAIVGIGVGSTGPVDVKSGSIVTYVSVPWKGFSLRDVIQERYPSLPVYMDVGSNMAAYGEVSIRPSLSTKTAVYITLGSGVGAGIVMSGTLYQTGPVNGFGHTSIDYNGPLCDCGNRGCLELYTSPSSIHNRYQKIRRERGLDDNSACTTLEEMIAASIAGEPSAVEALIQTADILSTAIVGLDNLIGPDVVIIGGSVPGIGEAFAPLVESALKEHFVHGIPHSISVLPAGLHDKSIALGAASFCFGMLLDSPEAFEKVLARTTESRETIIPV